MKKKGGQDDIFRIGPIGNHIICYYNMDCFLKSFTLLLIVAIIIIMYNNQINVLFGGGDINAKCMVCTEVHYNGYLTNWTVSHFVLFAIVGYMCPKNIYLFIL